jgi:hypothetical protein
VPVGELPATPDLLFLFLYSLYRSPARCQPDSHLPAVADQLAILFVLKESLSLAFGRQLKREKSGHTIPEPLSPHWLRHLPRLARLAEFHLLS